MSGFIAVSVSLIGLSGVLFTLAIFIQMILSFPAMLSSNSQAYVQQQRKIYHISAGPGSEEISADVDAEPETEFEFGEDVQEKVDDDSVERWIDVVDEAMNNSSLGLATAIQKTRRKRSIGAMRAAEPITRGRPLMRRRRRTTTTRPWIRLRNTGRHNDQSHYDIEMEQMHQKEWQPTQDRQHCNVAWRRNMKWT